jgi:hypothetical protein
MPSAAAPEVQTVYKPLRRRLPDERASITHKFNVGGHEGYLTIGLYEDGTPGEIFLRMAKEGSTISGLMDSFATAVSLALQYGVPLKDLVNKFSHLRFEPAGFTTNREIPMAKSITDYIFRWLRLFFLFGRPTKLRPWNIPRLLPRARRDRLWRSRRWSSPARSPGASPPCARLPTPEGPGGARPSDRHCPSSGWRPSTVAASAHATSPVASCSTSSGRPGVPLATSRSRS